MLQRRKLSKNDKPHGTTPMEAALKFLTPKARTVREVERHLDDQQFGEYEIMQVIERLTELGYVNDLAYAEEFVRTRLNTKPVSKTKLRMQLEAHEIPADIIETALSSISAESETERAMLAAEKYLRQLTAFSGDELRERLLRRLISRGFSYDDSNAAVKALLEQQNR
ncbi:MAG: RecX family transcriptional regulator [Eubacteriales bacterium]|nr:RecX family transcriptional regulator [Eubacteriales bacterium]